MAKNDPKFIELCGNLADASTAIVDYLNNRESKPTAKEAAFLDVSETIVAYLDSLMEESEISDTRLQ